MCPQGSASLLLSQFRGIQVDRTFTFSPFPLVTAGGRRIHTFFVIMILTIRLMNAPGKLSELVPMRQKLRLISRPSVPKMKGKTVLLIRRRLPTLDDHGGWNRKARLRWLFSLCRLTWRLITRVILTGHGPVLFSVFVRPRIINCGLIF